MKKIFFVMTILFLFYFVGTNAVSVFSYSENSNTEVIGEDISNDGYNSYSITYIGYMYNYDDSDDYLYVEFNYNSFAVYWKNSLELLEFIDNNILGEYIKYYKIYYFGPQSYYLKNGEVFESIFDHVSIEISPTECISKADKIREMFNNEVAVEGKMGIEDIYMKNNSNSSSNRIDNSVTGFDDSTATYISNYEYFLDHPYYGYNEHGTCTSVATQLILGYHNYYNDRRIISPEYLFGGWNSNGDGNYFNKLNYSDPQNSIYVTNNIQGMNSYLLGSNDLYYNHVINTMDPGSLLCGDILSLGATSDHTYWGAPTSLVESRLESLLSENLNSDDYEVEVHRDYLFGQPSPSEEIINEIDEGRPVLLGMTDNLDSFNHMVVAYGYLEYPDPITQNLSMGYIVEFGWNDYKQNLIHEKHKAWINSSWVDAYVTIKINHVHEYNVDSCNNFYDIYRELRCGECGHRKLFDLYTVTNNTITSVNYPLSGSVVIPSMIDGVTIEFIAPNIFENNTNISSVVIPNSVTSLSANIFSGCSSLVELEMPNSVTSIGESAFEGCTSLESITLSSSLTSIGSNVFKGCSSLVELDMPNSITSIGESAFEGCTDLENIALPSSLTSIGSNAFKGCSSLVELDIPNSVTSIGESAFEGCTDLESIALPSSLTSIGSKAFYNGNIGSIELPESLVSIGDYAFYDCNKLTNIVIPNSVETIGNNAFEWCDELTTVEIQKDTTPITSIGVNVFNNCSELENIIVPMSKILKYKNANNWSNYSNKISYDDVAEEMYVMYVNCYTDISEDEELQSRKSIVYELNVDCVKEYNIICSTTEELVVYLYDSNMELSGIYPTYSNSNHTATFITELPLGIYYLEISYSDYQKSGSISTTICPSNGSIHYTKTTGMTSILPHLHKVSSNTYKAQFSFTPTYKTGLHKLSLSGTTSSGSNIVFGSGSISVYDNLSKITPMYQYSMLGLDNLAVSGGKEILVYLEKNETYYIDVTLSSNQYSALNLQILTYYNCEIGAADLPPYDISIMSNNKSYGSDLCEFILHDAMDFTVTIEGLTEGKFIIYQEVINEEGIISYSLVKEESFTGDFTDSFSLEAGSYYIGYIDASTSDDMNYDIMRIVVD